MSELPNGWELARIGDICKVVRGGSPRPAGDPRFYDGDIPFIKVADLTKDKNIHLRTFEYTINEAGLSKTRQITPNTLLLTNSGATLGVPKISMIEGTINDGIAAFLDLDERLNLYLYYFWLSKTVELRQINQGAAQPNLNTEIIRNIEIPLPPINEQKRIAAKLDALLERVDACRARLERVPLLLKRFRQAVLAAATSGQLTEDWREENQKIENSQAELREITLRKIDWATSNSEHNEAARVERRARAFDVESVSSDDLPEQWCWSAIEDVCLMVVDCHNKTAPYASQGIPLVRTSNIRDGRLLWEEMRFVTEETYAYWSRRCPPEPNDIIFTREAPMGEATVIPPEHKICLGQRTMLFRPLHELTSVFYLLFAIMDERFKKRALSVAVGTGVKHLRVGDVSELQIPLPPLAEQTEIVRRVETLFAYADRLEARYQQARTEVERLTPALLAKAFRGELVTQDPNDEPAAALLARLQAERAATTAPPRSRSRSAAPATSARPVAASANVSTAQATRLPFDAEREPAAPTLQTKDDEAGDADNSDGATADTATTHTAKAATNGHRSAPPDIEEFDRETLLATLREVFTPGTRYDADTAIRTVAHTLGYARTGARIHERLKNTLRVAVQRGILVNESGEYRLDSRSIADYTHDECVATLLSALPRAWTDREEAIKAATRYLGFRRTGPALHAAFKSAINGAIRRGLLEYDRDTIRKV